MHPTLQQRLQAIPAVLRIPIGLAFVALGLGIGIYWCSAYSGAYRWLIELENDHLGFHTPLYVGMAAIVISTVVFGFAPFLLFAFILVLLNLFPADPEKPPVVEDRAEAQKRLEPYGGHVVGATVGVLGIIGGAIYLYLGGTAGSLQRLDLAALEAGQPPPSKHVEVEGRLLSNRELTQTKGIHRTHFVPLVSRQWKEGNHVRAYVRVPRERLKELKKGPIKGMLSEDGLPGPIRTSFEEDRRARPARPHYLIQFGVEPSTKTGMGWVFLVAGLVILAITALAFLNKWKRERDNPLRR